MRKLKYVELFEDYKYRGTILVKLLTGNDLNILVNHKKLSS